MEINKNTQRKSIFDTTMKINLILQGCPFDLYFDKMSCIFACSQPSMMTPQSIMFTVQVRIHSMLSYLKNAPEFYVCCYYSLDGGCFITVNPICFIVIMFTLLQLICFNSINIFSHLRASDIISFIKRILIKIIAKVFTMS